MDGFQVAERIKCDPRISAAMLMMLSSGAEAADVERCRQLEVDRYLTKPIKQSELFDAWRRCSSRGRQRWMFTIDAERRGAGRSDELSAHDPVG